MALNEGGATVREERGARRAFVLATIAAIAYSGWILAPFLNPGHDEIRSYVSELAAANEPFALFYQALDATAGTALVIASVLILRSSRFDRRLSMPFVLLGIFGFVTIIDALLPLSCTPTSDTVCAIEESLGLVPIAHKIHAVSSSVAGVVAAGSVLWTIVVRARNADLTPLGSASTALGLIHLVTLGWTTLEALGVFHLALGIAQRISLTALVLWWLILFADRVPGVSGTSWRTVPAH